MVHTLGYFKDIFSYVLKIKMSITCSKNEK